MLAKDGAAVDDETRDETVDAETWRFCLLRRPGGLHVAHRGRGRGRYGERHAVHGDTTRDGSCCGSIIVRPSACVSGTVGLPRIGSKDEVT